MTSMPFWNLTPLTTFGNWFSPFSRRHVFAAALKWRRVAALALLGRWTTPAQTDVSRVLMR